MISKQNAKESVRFTVHKLKEFLSQEGMPKLSQADTKANFIEKYISALGYE